MSVLHQAAHLEAHIVSRTFGRSSHRYLYASCLDWQQWKHEIQVDTLMFAPFSGAMLYVLKFQMLVCNSFPSLSVQAALEHRRVCVEFERETEGKDWVPRFPAHFGH